MSDSRRLTDWSTESGVLGDLQGQRHLYCQLAENALLVAENLRDNYLHNTAQFVHQLRLKILDAERRDIPPILEIHNCDDLTWSDVRDEVVTFIDGGVGRVQVASRAPILLRVGSYTVKAGERNISERESFGYYPVILGDLEGGSKERDDFIDVVRVTAEILGGLSALNRTPDLDALIFHGPLIYLRGSHTGHSPFTESDIDLFLRRYGVDDSSGRMLKQDFFTTARLDIYPAMTPRSHDWITQRLFEPLAFLAFLQQRLIASARAHPHQPLIVGVVERGRERSFVESVLLPRVFRGLREKGNENWFNDLFGRHDLTTEHAVTERLGYSDTFLLGMLLRPGQLSEPWTMHKYGSLASGALRLPSEGFETAVDWSVLRPGNRNGFPEVSAGYVCVTEVSEPIRIEVFSPLGPDEIYRAAKRVYLYARLLPGYGFPVGLDIADKHARVPDWLTRAYGKMIRYQLGVSLQQGEITDVEMRRILVQAIHMTHRDWLFRPLADGVIR